MINLGLEKNYYFNMHFPILAKISTRYRNFQQDIRRIARLCSQPSEGTDTFTNNKTETKHNRMKSKDHHIIPDSREHLTFNHEEKDAETSLSDPDL